MADERTAARQERWRLRIGVLVFIAGFAAPAAIPLIAASTLPMIWKTILSGALAVGVPEVMMVAAIAIMGKAGFAQLKQRLGRLMRQYGPPQHVGPARYRIGLVLFFLPLLVGWLGVYVWHLVPGFEKHAMFWFIGGDVMFIASFFVLGGEFWDKTRALFIHEAKAILPDEPAAGPGGQA